MRWRKDCMKAHKKYFASLILLLSASILCHLQAKPNSEPVALKDLFSEQRPFDLYVKAYGSFQFVSKSSLISGDQLKEEPEEGKTEVNTMGRSSLIRDQKGNYHFVRIPLTGTPQVDLIYVGRKFFLRKKQKDAFRETRHQQEFETWVNNAFREVFQLFEKEDFLAATKEEENNQTCLKNDKGVLCLDADTGLPISGQIESIASVAFSVESIVPDSLRIVLPPPSEGTPK